MMTSILHRMTGVALGAGTLLLAWWLLAAAGGPEEFATVKAFFGHWTGRAVLFGFSLALFFHLINGIRHLFWDAGLGFEVETATGWSWVIIFASVVLTVIAWVFGYGLVGG